MKHKLGKVLRINGSKQTLLHYIFRIFHEQWRQKYWYQFDSIDTLADFIVPITHHNTFDTWKLHEELPENFLQPFSINRIFLKFDKIFMKSTQNINKLYWNLINFVIIIAKFSQKFSKFFPNIPKILFKIYFKFHTNFIQNLSKILWIFS